MTLGEWMESNPRAVMNGLRLADPDGVPFRLAHAWRVGQEEPPRIGMFLYVGDATEGKCEARFVPYDEWRKTWTVRGANERTTDG